MFLQVCFAPDPLSDTSMVRIFNYVTDVLVQPVRLATVPQSN